MKSRFLILVAAVTLFAALAMQVGFAAQEPRSRTEQPQHYKLTVLGTLGGAWGEAWGVNNRGAMAGHSSLPGDQTYHAFFWQRGVITDLGTLGGPNSNNSPSSPLNDKGVVTGFSDTSTLDPNGENFCGFGTQLICLPFVWQNGVMTALPTLGGNNAQAGGINNRGEIGGEAEGPNTDPCSPFALEVSAVIWRDGHIQQVLPPFRGSAAAAGAINDNGDTVGLSGCSGTFYAVLWSHGEPINLGTLGGVFGNIPGDINNRGQVVGQSDLPGDTVHHAFLWENGVMADLGSLSAALPTSVANGINNKGQVVGFSQNTNGDDSSSVAWVWQNGVMTNLNELIPANSPPLFLMEALSVNDRGDIAGFGRLSNGEHRGFVLTPCNDGDEGCGEGGDERTMLPTNSTLRTLPNGTLSPPLRRWMGLGRFSGLAARPRN